MSKASEQAVEKQVAGSLKQAIGKVTGDARIEREGAAAQESGDRPGDTPMKTDGS